MPYSATPPKPGHDAALERLVELARVADRKQAGELLGSGSIFQPSIPTTVWPSFIR